MMVQSCHLELNKNCSSQLFESLSVYKLELISYALFHYYEIQIFQQL